MAFKAIQVGTGGFGSMWCRTFLPPNVADGLVEVVAAADVDPKALVHAREGLGLREDQCYTDVQKAMDEHPADFCIIVVPPSRHEGIVDLALTHNLHILSEKPIADTMDASVRIARKVAHSGKKMGVTMSHRFDQDKSTLRALLSRDEMGALDYLVMRFTCDCRAFGSWGIFRHQIPDALMVEGAVHHLDILADLAGARCDTLYAQTWNPPWGEFAGHSQGLVSMRFANGTRALYEGAKTNAAGLNGWGGEYIRAECEGATIEMNRRTIRLFRHGAPLEPDGLPRAEPVPLLEQAKWANTWLIEKFVRWLDGGEPMETNIEDNLQSVALVFAAIESSRTGQAVRVQDFLSQTRARAECAGDAR